jgi:double-strand break repair protein MRE11
VDTWDKECCNISYYALQGEQRSCHTDASCALQDHLSAIDILAACNLVNYFGKAVLGGNGVGQISMYPVLLQKGSTKVALYGLGNIRDERLNRMFQTPHAVQWIRPESLEGCPTSEWFNIFVLHQNRVKTNPKNAINEHFLARFLDFVIWGHEHECLIDPQEVLGMDFHVTQPGSSVATSLVAGEAKPKHVLLLEIKGNQYRPTKIPLGSVRPFEFMDVSLKDQPDLDPNDQTAVLEYLGKVVNDLISKAAENEAGHQEAMVPLIRVRVDYTGFTTINPQRFGQKFVGKVANPHDILLFTKAAKKRASTDGPIDEKEKLRPEELNQQNIEALVAESNLKMEILPVTDLGMALHDFVNKDDKQAFYACVHQNLDVTQNKLTEEADLRQIQEESDVVVKVGEHMQVSFSFLLLTSAVVISIITLRHGD